MIAMVLSVEVTKAQASMKQERVQLRSQGGRLDDGSRNGACKLLSFWLYMSKR